METDTAIRTANPSDQVVTIRGEAVVMREFRYGEGLKITAGATDFLTGLRELVDAADKDGGADIDGINGLIAQHAELWTSMIAIACDREPAWVAALSDQDAMRLQLAFWAANKNFFMRHIYSRLIQRMAKHQQSATGESDGR